jgi:hypothetical protein
MIAGLIHWLFALVGAAAGALVCGCTMGYLLDKPWAANDLGGLLLVLMLNGFPAAVIGALVGGSCGLWYGNRFTGD